MPLALSIVARHRQNEGKYCWRLERVSTTEAGHNVTILVVAADYRVRRVVGWVLDELCIEHLDVQNWRAGVAVIGRQHPALVIADWDDVGDGTGLAALLKTGWRRPVRLVILSGRGDLARLATEVGAHDGLAKPVNGPRLMATLERVARGASG